MYIAKWCKIDAELNLQGLEQRHQSDIEDMTESEQYLKEIIHKLSLYIQTGEEPQEEHSDLFSDNCIVETITQHEGGVVNYLHEIGEWIESEYNLLNDKSNEV